MPAGAARAAGDHERDDADDKGDRRHHDRPEARFGGALGGRRNRKTLLAQLIRELDDQDRVLAREPDEHDEADLRVHVGGQQAEIVAGKIEMILRPKMNSSAPSSASGTDIRMMNGSVQALVLRR